MDMEEYRVDVKTKLSYLCGDFGMCLMNYMIIDYFMFYCTNMIGLSLVTAGMIFFVCRIWDAANDLLVGWAVDKTHTKVGKARPWIKWFTGPTALATFMMFAATPSMPYWLKITLAGGGFFLNALFYTTINLPYGSMLTLMTKNSVDRASLAVWRIFGARIGILVVSATALPMVSFFGNMFGQRSYGYTIVTGIMCVFGALLCLILYWGCPERVYEENMAAEAKLSETARQAKRQKEKETSILKDVSYLVRNAPWLIIFFTFLITFLRQPFTRTSLPYYMIYYMGIDETNVALYASSSLIASMVASLFIGKCVAKFGTKTTMIWSFLITAVVDVGCYMVGINTTWLLILYCVATATAAFSGPVGLALLADSIEYGDLKFDRRLEGLGNAAYSFATKAGPAIGSLIVTIFYAWGGLDTSLKLGQAQSETAIGVVRFVTFLAPAILMAVQAFIVWLYPLSEEKYKEVLKALEARNKERETA